MILNPANSDTENSIEKKRKKNPPRKNHIQRKLENTLFERYQNKMALGVDYLTKIKFAFLNGVLY